MPYKRKNVYYNTIEELEESLKRDYPNKKPVFSKAILEFYDREKLYSLVESRDYYKAAFANCKSLYSIYKDDEKLEEFLDYLVFYPALTCLEWFTCRNIKGVSFASRFAKSKVGKYIKLFGLDPKTVVDPFAGWGDRAEACKKLGIEYVGYDINTYKEHAGFNISKRDIFTTPVDNTHYDLLVTCPPYFTDKNYPIEVYPGFSYEKSVYNEMDIVDKVLEVYPNCDYYLFFLSRFYDRPVSLETLAPSFLGRTKRKVSDKILLLDKNKEIIHDPKRKN